MDIRKPNKESLMVFGSIAGFGTACVFSFKAGTKAHQLLEEKKMEDAKNVEKLKATYKCYIPPIISFVLSTTLLCIATKGMNHKAVVATAAATVMQTTASEIKNKTEEVVGEKKAKEIYDKIAEDKIKQSEAEIRKVYVHDGKDYPVMESYLGNVFNSNAEDIKKVQNAVNQILMEEGRVTFADLYDEFNLKPPTAAYCIGWDWEFCHKIEFIFNDGHTSDGVPCMVISYDETPGIFEVRG